MLISLNSRSLYCTNREINLLEKVRFYCLFFIFANFIPLDQPSTDCAYPCFLVVGELNMSTHNSKNVYHSMCLPNSVIGHVIFELPMEVT